MSTPVFYYEDDFMMGNYEISDKKENKEEEKTNIKNTEKKIEKKEKEEKIKIMKQKSLEPQNIRRNNNITKVSFDDKIDVIDVESYKEFNKLLFINNLIEEENEESMCNIF